MSERGAHQGVIAEAAPFRFTRARTRCSPRRRAQAALARHRARPRHRPRQPRRGRAHRRGRRRRRRASSPSAAPPRSRRPRTRRRRVRSRTSPLAQEANLVRALERCKEAGFWVAGAVASTPSRRVWDAPLEGTLVLVMGAEGEGLARLTREACDFLVRLPAGRQGRVAQRRAGRDRARVRVAAARGVREREPRAHADRRRLQRHPTDAAVPRARRGRPRRRACRARLRRRRVRPRGVAARRSCSTGTATRARTGGPTMSRA